ncbi:NAD(P)-binding domain-containing protein [Streptomyces sp900105245]|uniref:NADPH-dependent F420 reductase n=1 Tax=Streptomyces sp. 900105245 TaxID=3154379 RepID=UPI00332D9B52
MPLTLGLIGSGAIRTALARLAVAAGLDVVLGNSRGPETLSELVDTLGSHARAATPAEAAQAGDLVVVTVPLTALDRLPADALNGKIVLDTGNYHPQRDGQTAELDNDEITSSGLLQRQQETGHPLDLLGYDAVDIGMLADSWRSEPNNPVYVEPYRGVAPEGLEPKEWWVWSLEDPGTPVGAAQVRELVASAERGLVASAERGPSRAGLLPAGLTL